MSLMAFSFFKTNLLFFTPLSSRVIHLLKNNLSTLEITIYLAIYNPENGNSLI